MDGRDPDAGHASGFDCGRRRSVSAIPGGESKSLDRTLRTETYLAVASLSHPVFPTSNESTTREPTASRVRTLIANPRVRKTLAVIASITMIVAIYALAVGAFVALFRLASQVVLDAAMVAIFGSFVTFTLIEVSLTYVAVLEIRADGSDNLGLR